MRSLIAAGFVLALVALPGCGSGNKGKVEKLTNDMVTEINAIATALENGDKSAIDAAIPKIKNIAQQLKGLKITKSESSTLKAKFDKDMQAANTRMMSAVNAARTNGKWKPADLMEVGMKMTELGEAMKQMTL